MNSLSQFVLTDGIRTHDTRGRMFREIEGIDEHLKRHIQKHPVDLDWLEASDRLGPATAVSFHELTMDERTNLRYVLYRLRDLRRQPDSDYGGPIFNWPQQQVVGAWRPDRNKAVYHRNKRGLKALADAGRLTYNREYVPKTKNKEWKHDFFSSMVGWSLFLGAKEFPELYRFKYQDEIVAELGGLQEFDIEDYPRDKDGNPRKDKQGRLLEKREYTIKPDGINSIVYLPTGEERIILREEDCHSEPFNSDDYGRKSHAHTIDFYAVLIGHGETRRKYFGERKVVVANTFSDPAVMQNVMDIALERSKRKGISYQLYRAWPAFGPFFRPPGPRTELFFQGWARAGQEPFYLCTPDGNKPVVE